MQTVKSENEEQTFADLTVLIPTLNEAEAIGKVIDEVLDIGIPKENILIVDGGSTDGTREIVASRGIRVIIQEGKGKTDAVKSAIKYIKTQYTLLMDGDYTYPAKHIPELYAKVKQGYDLVIGVRKFNPENQALTYRLGNKLLTWFFNLLFNTNLHDVLSGMYIVRTKILKELTYETKGFGIESEIAAYVVSTSKKIAEVPIEYRKRLGKKKLGVKHGFQIFREIIRLAWKYNPVFLIFFSSALLLIPGLALIIWMIYQHIVIGIEHHIEAMMAVMLTLAGLQALLLAILALYLKRMEYRLQNILKSKISSNE